MSELDPREREALRSLRRSAVPSPRLEDRVVGRLREAGLVGRGRLLRAVAWAAVLAGAFLAGVAVGGRGNADPGAIERPRFVLLLREGPSYRAAPTSDAERARIAEYAGWARDLAAEGRFVDGEKLADEEHVVGSSDPQAGVVAGYFVIEADSYEEAARLARALPHVRYGGSVEVRRIERAP